MRKPAIKSLGPRLKRAALVAMAAAVVPGAAALAEHFKTEHPLLYTPSAESELFCTPTFLELDEYASTPTVEEYLLDQLCR